MKPALASSSVGLGFGFEFLFPSPIMISLASILETVSMAFLSAVTVCSPQRLLFNINITSAARTTLTQLQQIQILLQCKSKRTLS